MPPRAHVSYASTWPPRLVTLVIACIGALWSVSGIRQASVEDDMLDLEARLLNYEALAPAAANAILARANSEPGSACHTHLRRALQLLEISNSDHALRSGATGEHDRLISSLELRTLRGLNCSPRDSFSWLVAFGLAAEEGSVNDNAFARLGLSYSTAPHEAWIAVRRIGVAVPLLSLAPPALQELVLAEFQDLVALNYLDVTARAFASASPAVQALLRTPLRQLPPGNQKAFEDALVHLRRT